MEKEVIKKEIKSTIETIEKLEEIFENARIGLQVNRFVLECFKKRLQEAGH